MKYRLDRIGLLLVLTGKTQSEVSKELGISKHTLGKYINGKRGKKIDFIILKSICEYFEVPDKIFLQHTVHFTIEGDKLNIL